MIVLKSPSLYITSALIAKVKYTYISKNVKEAKHAEKTLISLRKNVTHFLENMLGTKDIIVHKKTSDNKVILPLTGNGKMLIDPLSDADYERYLVHAMEAAGNPTGQARDCFELVVKDKFFYFLSDIHSFDEALNSKFKREHVSAFPLQLTVSPDQLIEIEKSNRNFCKTDLYK